MSQNPETPYNQRELTPGRESTPSNYTRPRGYDQDNVSGRGTPRNDGNRTPKNDGAKQSRASQDYGAHSQTNENPQEAHKRSSRSQVTSGQGRGRASEMQTPSRRSTQSIDKLNNMICDVCVNNYMADEKKGRDIAAKKQDAILAGQQFTHNRDA